jgi:type II secretory pathway pseudopilin PulG
MNRLREEQGMGMIELLAAIVIITVAILALMASYDQAFFSLHAAARKTAAASLAETQLELFSAAYNSTTTYSTIGLNSTLVTAAATDTYYPTDAAALSGTTVSNTTCTSTLAQCKPVQTSVLGSDGKHYRVETFVRDVSQTLSCQGQTTSCGTATERVVTVIVRDPNVSRSPKIYTASVAFDQGPRS